MKKIQMELPTNREKSGIRYPVHFTILGFGCEHSYVKGERGKYQLVVSCKRWKSLKQKLKTLTRKTIPVSIGYERKDQSSRTYNGVRGASQLF